MSITDFELGIAEGDRMRPERGPRCRLVQQLAVIEDESRCQAATAVLLERAYRRWSGHADCEHFPPLQRWRAVESGYLDGAEQLPAAFISAAVAGHRAPVPDLAAGLQAVVVLHSGCPAVVQETRLPGRDAGALSDDARHTVLISIYGLREDDMTLAESVLTGCVRLGALHLVERFSRWLPARAAAGLPPAADPVPARFSSPASVPAQEPLAACGGAAVPVPVRLRRG
ncbi:hypothetical protein [Nocardia spumae]|uniref:hypothetical protein n=1 Tax=Nocardia spumae TaxID=2887190 RepID=UPI001D152C43|nr:hypothetical protein [Nocardia spumae]